ncbi:hypothetical protein Tco_0459257 [Tanacetum coccineum]
MTTHQFPNFTVGKEEFIPIIEKGLNEEIEGHYMFKVASKLKMLMYPLRKLAWKNRNLQDRVEKCIGILKSAQVLMENNPHDDQLKKEEAKCLSLYLEAITSICNEKGEKFEGKDVAEQFVSHFKRFLGAKKEIDDLDDSNLFHKKISHEDAINMVIWVTDKKIKEAMFDIGDNKAPGPDGFTSTFFKNSWNIVGKEVCLDVQEFFKTGKLLGEISATVISLILKIQQPNKVFDFRPIACCNVLYKCISKILTARIKGVPNKIVNPNQSAFIPDALLEFSKASGLLPNMDKSVIFFGSVKENVKQRILHVLPFRIRKLPVKYLGIPLLAKRLGVKECKCLVDKVKNKVLDWKNKFLSYVGRLQLIASILLAIQAYWAVVVKIPKTIVKDIDRVLKKFLWSNNALSKGRSKVAWKIVCKPKCEGGLGLRQLEEWNDVLLTKQIWRIISKKDSMWVKWVNLVKVKGRSFWDISDEKNDSCTWKALLGMRNKVKPFFVHTMGNGRDIAMWSDSWCTMGHLNQYISNMMLFDARIKENRALVDMIENGSWNWPVEWSQQVPILNNIHVPSLNENANDHVKCRNSEEKLVEFNIKSAWWDLRNQMDTVKCKVNDSHDHLFFKCDFFKEIWKDYGLYQIAIAKLACEEFNSGFSLRVCVPHLMIPAFDSSIDHHELTDVTACLLGSKLMEFKQEL